MEELKLCLVLLLGIILIVKDMIRKRILVPYFQFIQAHYFETCKKIFKSFKQYIHQPTYQDFCDCSSTEISVKNMQTQTLHTHLMN